MNRLIAGARSLDFTVEEVDAREHRQLIGIGEQDPTSFCIEQLANLDSKIINLHGRSSSLDGRRARKAEEYGAHQLPIDDSFNEIAVWGFAQHVLQLGPLKCRYILRKCCNHDLDAR